MGVGGGGDLGAWKRTQCPHTYCGWHHSLWIWGRTMSSSCGRDMDGRRTECKDVQRGVHKVSWIRHGKAFLSIQHNVRDKLCQNKENSTSSNGRGPQDKKNHNRVLNALRSSDADVGESLPRDLDVPLPPRPITLSPSHSVTCSRDCCHAWPPPLIHAAI